MIEKAPILDLPRLSNIAENQRDAYHQYYFKQFVKWVVEKQLFVGEIPVEGKPYQFLGCYITKWGHTDKPGLAFVRFSETEEWQSLLQEAGEK